MTANTPDLTPGLTPEFAEAELILERCDDLAGISSLPGAMERVHLSPEHTAANALVAQWMREAGLATWQDAAGNQCGRLEGAEPDLPALLLGSHIDTVPDAGRYDGMLGVLLAIQVVDRIRTSGVSLPFALEVVAFSDEEGTRFGMALLGSRALSGTWKNEWWDLTDKNGITLAEAFQDFGLDPARLHGAFRRPEKYLGTSRPTSNRAPTSKRRANGSPLSPRSPAPGASTSP